MFEQDESGNSFEKNIFDLSLLKNWTVRRSKNKLSGSSRCKSKNKSGHVKNGVFTCQKRTPQICYLIKIQIPWEVLRENELKLSSGIVEFNNTNSARSMNNLTKQYWVNRVHIKVMSTDWKSQRRRWLAMRGDPRLCSNTKPKSQSFIHTGNLLPWNWNSFILCLWNSHCGENEKLNFRINYS